jgi:hypothetical protein
LKWKAVEVEGSRQPVLFLAHATVGVGVGVGVGFGVAEVMVIHSW